MGNGFGKIKKKMKKRDAAKKAADPSFIDHLDKSERQRLANVLERMIGEFSL
jgi:hypothetical protein